MESEFIQIRLSDGSICHVEIDRQFISGREKVSTNEKIFDFELVKNQIQKISEEFREIFSKVKPTKTTLEFGIELSVEAGQLTSIIVKGSGKSNLKITLEWEYK